MFAKRVHLTMQGLEQPSPAKAAEILGCSVEEAEQAARAAGWTVEPDGTWIWRRNKRLPRNKVAQRAELLSKLNAMMAENPNPSLIAEKLDLPYHMVYQKLDQLGWRYVQTGTTPSGQPIMSWVKQERGQQVRDKNIPSYRERIYQLLTRFGTVSATQVAQILGCTAHSARQTLSAFAKMGYIRHFSSEGVLMHGFYELEPDFDPYLDGFFTIPEHPIYERDAQRFQELFQKALDNR